MSAKQPIKPPSKKRRRANQVRTVDEEQIDTRVPRSIVFRKGSVTKTVARLVGDIRQILEPLTSARLKERSHAHLRDYVSVCTQLSVSHLLCVSATELAVYLRVLRVPHGPTLSFRIDQFSLCADVARVQKKPTTMVEADKIMSPLLVCKGFDLQKREDELCVTMFQSLFPAIDVKKTKLAHCRRVVLLMRGADDDYVDLRHYAIRMRPAGVKRPVRKLAELSKKLPKLTNVDDIADYVLNDEGALSESEADVDERVDLHQAYAGSANRAAAKASEGDGDGTQSALRLRELGPRLRLRLVKVQDGLGDGKVLFHRFVQKSADEQKELEKRLAQREALRAQRRAEQERNVVQKAAAVAEMRGGRLTRKERKELKRKGLWDQQSAFGNVRVNADSSSTTTTTATATTATDVEAPAYWDEEFEAPLQDDEMSVEDDSE